MKRREFLGLAKVAGAAVVVPALAGARQERAKGARAAATDEPGPLFVMVQATGGWDPTLLCDPKPELNRSYGEEDILTAGNIAYVPVGAASAFFERHHGRMVVINGIDVQTNGHDAGRRHMASGRLGEGHPTAAAVVAGHGGPHLPMALLTFGGYERTSGLVAPTRNLTASRLAELAHPDRIDPANPQSPTYHDPAAAAAILAARDKRAARRHAAARLPRYVHATSTMIAARTGSTELQRLEEFLPAPHANAAFRRVQLIVAAYRAGICVAANLEKGGFDTHGDHDARHRQRMSELVDLLAFVWDEAERQEVADRLIVVVSSDFGRTPRYNDDGGKDHWPTSSMIVMGAGLVGNRVVGATDAGHEPIPLDPVTLEAAANPDQGVRIRPAHVHRNLRRLLGIEGSDVDAMFPLPVDEDLHLF